MTILWEYNLIDEITRSLGLPVLNHFALAPPVDVKAISMKSRIHMHNSLYKNNISNYN